MENNERASILDSLLTGRDALAASLRGVTDELAIRTPGQDRWSILQCLDHVAVVEDYLFGQIVIATEADGAVGSPEREARIRERAADRSRPIAAPAEGTPSGRFATVAEALNHFLESRARTIEFVETTAADLRMQVTTHPLIPKVNCYEVLLMIAAHPHRHAQQIAEIRAALESGA